MLPKIEQPHYNTKLPISGKEVKYRPYLMKEQKIVLLSKDSENPDDLIEAITQVISNCTNETINARELNSVDVAFLMTKIRSASEGSILELNVRCMNEITSIEDDGITKTKRNCNHRNPVDVDLEGISLTSEFDEEKSKVDLGNGVGMKLKIPTIEILGIQDETKIFEILPTLIDFVYDAEEVYPIKEVDKNDLQGFLESLKAKDVKQITDFFQQMPRLKVDIPFTCESCGNHEVVSEEDIQNFLN